MLRTKECNLARIENDLYFDLAHSDIKLLSVLTTFVYQLNQEAKNSKVMKKDRAVMPLF